MRCLFGGFGLRFVTHRVGPRPSRPEVLRLPFASEQGTTDKGLTTFTRKPRPESGRDCLVCAIFARQWETHGLP